MGKILLVEDNDISVLLVQEYLKNTGLEITVCSNCAGCKKVLESGARFDLIMLDLKLPDDGGHELCKGIEALAPGIPVVIYSAYSKKTIENILKKSTLMPCGILIKPTSSDDIIKTINHCLNTNIAPCNKTQPKEL